MIRIACKTWVFKGISSKIRIPWLSLFPCHFLQDFLYQRNRKSRLSNIFSDETTLYSSFQNIFLFHRDDCNRGIRIPRITFLILIEKMEERRHALFCSLWMMKIQIVIFGTFQNILIDSIWLFDEISEYFVETLGNNAAVFFWRNPYSSRFIRQSLQNNYLDYHIFSR